jgi:hypothetical protein
VKKRKVVGAFQELILQHEMANHTYRLVMTKTTLNGIFGRVRRLQGYEAKRQAMAHLLNGWAVSLERIS